MLATVALGVTIWEIMFVMLASSWVNCQPLLQLAEGPLALALVCGVRVDDASDTVLHTFLPFSLVLASVRVGICSFTVLLVESILSFVLAAVLPDVVAVAVHDTALEHSFEVAAIRPLEVAEATHLIVGP